jgi:ankyrin repeat protein
MKSAVDLDESDITRRRPLHLATNAGDLDLMKQLLTKKTTLETLDHQEMNWLYYATLSRLIDDDPTIESAAQ